MSNLNFCPNCNAKVLPDEDQPQPSLHLCSNVFECGTDIICFIDGNIADVKIKCDIKTAKENVETLTVRQYYVAYFNYNIDDYTQYGITMSLDGCRRFIKSCRDSESYEKEDLVIIAILDE